GRHADHLLAAVGARADPAAALPEPVQRHDLVFPGRLLLRLAGPPQGLGRVPGRLGGRLLPGLQGVQPAQSLLWKCPMSITDELAIRVRGLSKMYKLYDRPADVFWELVTR